MGTARRQPVHTNYSGNLTTNGPIRQEPPGQQRDLRHRRSHAQCFQPGDAAHLHALSDAIRLRHDRVARHGDRFRGHLHRPADQLRRISLLRARRHGNREEERHFERHAVHVSTYAVGIAIVWLLSPAISVRVFGAAGLRASDQPVQSHTAAVGAERSADDLRAGARAPLAVRGTERVAFALQVAFNVWFVVVQELGVIGVVYSALLAH